MGVGFTCVTVGLVSRTNVGRKTFGADGLRNFKTRLYYDVGDRAAVRMTFREYACPPDEKTDGRGARFENRSANGKWTRKIHRVFFRLCPRRVGRRDDTRSREIIVPTVFVLMTKSRSRIFKQLGLRAGVRIKMSIHENHVKRIFSGIDNVRTRLQSHCTMAFR